MTDAPPRKLTFAHQALANLLGFVCVQIIHDQRFADMVQALTDILPAARHDVPPAFVPVIEAAETVANLFPEVRKARRGMDWQQAMFQADAAMAAFFTARALAALEAHEAERTAHPHHHPQP